MTQGDRRIDDIQKLTDFFVCDSMVEAGAAAEESDLPAEAFDRRVVRDYSRSGRECILVFACPECVEGARSVVGGRRHGWSLFVAKLRLFWRRTRKR